MKEVKVYVAGKVSPNSVFGRHDWRDGFCERLSTLSGCKVKNLDPTKSDKGFDLDEGDAELIFGRDVFMIRSADVVIVNLTNDISVGGSQEMLIAKYFNKPLIGIAPKEGKFHKKKKNIQGKEYGDYIHPFVLIPCDDVVENIEEAAVSMKKYVSDPNKNVKNMDIIENSIKYYVENFYEDDNFLKGVV